MDTLDYRNGTNEQFCHSHHYNLYTIIYVCYYYNICVSTNSTHFMTIGPTQTLQNSTTNINTFCNSYYRLTTETCMLLPMSGYFQCGIMKAGGIIQ